MPFTIIKSTFHVLGYSPDGDSIRFRADNEANWATLSGRPPRLNARRHAQLRLEARYPRDPLLEHPPAFGPGQPQVMGQLLGVVYLNYLKNPLISHMNPKTLR